MAVHNYLETLKGESCTLLLALDCEHLVSTWKALECHAVDTSSIASHLVSWLYSPGCCCVTKACEAAVTNATTKLEDHTDGNISLETCSKLFVVLFLVACLCCPSHLEICGQY